VIDIATNSATTCGIRLTNNTALIGAGGTSATPTYYVKCDPSNSLIDISGNTKITGTCEITGQLTAPSSFILPYIQANDLYYCMGGVKTALQTSSVIYPNGGGIICYTPYFITKTVTGINRLAIRSAAASTFPTLHLGLYTANPTTGLPETQLISGTVVLGAAAGTNIVNPTTPSSVTLNRGYYWSAFLCTGGVNFPTNVIDGITASTTTMPEMLINCNVSNGSYLCPLYVSASSQTSLPATATGLTRQQNVAIPYILIGKV
jgi:hypothetical protein